MLSISLHHPEDVTLPHRVTHSSHLQSKSFTNADDKSIFTKQQTSEMGHIVFTIWDAIHATKGDQRSSCDRFSGRSSNSRNFKTLWWSLRWDRWRLTWSTPFWKNKYGNNSLMEHQERILREISLQVRGVVLISPYNYMIPHAFSLTEACSNNVSKYNALLIRI